LSAAEAESRHWQAAVANADLGLPVPRGARLRLLKRVIARVCRPFLSRQTEFNRELLAELVTIRNDLVAQIQDSRCALSPAAVEEVAARVTLLEGTVERHEWAVDAALPVLERHGYAIDALQEGMEDIEVDRNLVHQEVELAQQQAFARVHDEAGALRSEIGCLVRRIEERLQRSERLSNELQATRMRLTHMDLILDRFRHSLPELPAPVDLASLPTLFDAMYAAFEEAMRGPVEVISERVAAYVPELAQVKHLGPILDIGCGRGELLQLLREEKIESYGVDTNAVYVERCTSEGLNVQLGDALDHLRSIPDRSLGGITAIQVVEHLPMDYLIEFLSQAIRVIRPGGILVLETPNPENVTVGASTFYLDPTHQRPIPPPLLEFIVRSRGFSNTEVRYLKRSEDNALPLPSADHTWANDLAPILDVVNTRFFGAQDYAVVAHRA